MAKSFAKSFYQSQAWRKCRKAFIAERVQIDGGICQECGEDVGFIVHHRVWLTPENISDPFVTLDYNNLKYVCHTCHNKIEQGLEGEVRYRFGENGDVLPPL